MPYDIYSRDGADAAFAPKDGVLDGGTASAPLYDIRIRHDDTAGWAAEDPILSIGEEGIDTDTGTRKVGDGVTAWSSLPASGGGGGGGAVDSVNGETGAVVLDAADVGAATAAQGALADTAVQPADLTAYATDADLAAHAADTTAIHGIADTSALVLTSDARLTDARAPLPHTSASVTDFTEAAQDAIAALLAGASGVSLSYNDAGNTLTITGPGTAGLDAEAVRDAIGVALVGTGLITVTVNDALDTITLSTTATANATDAALRDRTTHTGAQATSTVTGLDAALAAAAQKSANLSDLANAGTARTNLGLGTSATTAATSYATAAQGAAADAALAAAAAPELIRDTMATALVAGANVTITPNDGADTITIAASGGGGGVVDFQSYPTPVGQYAPIVRAGGFTSAALSTTTQNSTSLVRLTPLVVSGDYSFDRIAQSINAASTEAGATIGLAVYSRTGELILDCGEASALTTGLKTMNIDLALSRGIYFTALRFRASTFAGVNPTFFWASQCDGLAVSNVPDSNNYITSLAGFVLPSANPFPSQITTWAFTSTDGGAPINLLRRSA